MKFSRLVIGCVLLSLGCTGTCTDRRQRLQEERRKARAQERVPYTPPRPRPEGPSISERARVRVAARQEAAKTGKALTILYSANLVGEYEAQPLGGLARRATMVKQTRAAGERVVDVDAGDSLLPRLPDAPEPPPDKKEVDRRATLVATGLGRMKLDAITPGENELAMGLAKYKSLARKAGLPIVSANLKDARGKLLFQPYRIVETPDLKVGIFGVTTLAVNDAEKLRPQGITADAALNVAQATISVLREKGAQAVIGLFHVAGGTSEARNISRELTGLDVMVLGHQGRRLSQRQRVNREDRWMLEPHERGRMLGKMEMKIGEEAIAWKSEIERLDTRFDSDPGMQALIKPYIEESKRRVARKLPVGLSARAGSRGELATAAQEKWTYAGNEACGLCHDKAKEHFLTTPHASAMATLERIGRQRDPQCLLCHSTGFDRPGGTQNLATAAKYFGEVGCESCHGPSAEHVRAQDKKTGTVRAVPEAMCKECHTPEQSLEPFDYVAAMKGMVGPGHAEGFAATPAPPRTRSGRLLEELPPTRRKVLVNRPQSPFFNPQSPLFKGPPPGGTPPAPGSPPPTPSSPPPAPSSPPPAPSSPPVPKGNPPTP